MVDTPISGFPAITSLGSSDLLLAVQAGNTSRITAANARLSALATRAAAGTAATAGLQVGASTVGLFSGGSGATEYLGLTANGTEFARCAVSTSYFELASSIDLNVKANQWIRFNGLPVLSASASTVTLIANAALTSLNISPGNAGLFRATSSGVRIQASLSSNPSDIFHVANSSGDILRCSDSLGTVGIGGAPVSGVGLSVTNTGEAARFRYDASNYLTITVSSAGLPTYTAVGSGSRRHTFVSPGATDSGLLTHVVVDSSATLALGVGGAVTMRGAYTGTTRTDFAAIKGYKETATDGETGGHLDLYSRTNGSNLAANLRVAASGSTLSRASITTQTPSASAQFQVDSTTKGFLPPRMTEAQRDAIGTPAAGLIVYNTDTNLLNFYNGSAWGAI